MTQTAERPPDAEGGLPRDATPGPENRGRTQSSILSDEDKLLRAANDQGLPFIDLVAWGDREAPARQWLSPGLIPYGCVTSLYGDGGSGKTMLALSLMIAMASKGSVQWMGTPIKGWRSVGVFAEDDEPELVRRLQRIAAAEELEFAKVAGFMSILPGVGVDCTCAGIGPDGYMLPTPFLKAVAEKVKADGASLLVLDYAAAVFGGNELSRAEVSEFMRLLNGMARDLDIALLLLGHPSYEGMKGGRGTSGSTAWRNQARAFLHLTVDEDQCDPDGRTLLTLKLSKANYTKAGKTFHLASDGSTFEIIEAGQIAKSKPLRLPPSQKVAIQALQRAIDDDGEASPGGPIPTGVRIVKIETWRSRAYQMEISGASQDARKRAFSRAAESLQARGLVGVSAPYCWIVEGDK